RPPAATITAPAAGTRYTHGQTILFAGTADDPEDGALPAGAYTWRVDFGHDTHFHPHLPPTSGITGRPLLASFAGPPATVFYRIYLTVTDSAGATFETYRDVLPQTVLLTVNSNPAGLQVVLDGQAVTAPVASVVGMTRGLSAVSPQVRDGTVYQFSS